MSRTRGATSRSWRSCERNRPPPITSTCRPTRRRKGARHDRDDRVAGRHSGRRACPDRCVGVAAAERAIEHGQRQVQRSFVVIGGLLREIRDARVSTGSRTSRLSCTCKSAGTSRARAYRLIAAAEVAQIVSPMGDIPNERAARPLVAVLRDEGEAAVIDTMCELRAKHGEELDRREGARRGRETRGSPGAPLWWVKGAGKAFVDFQNDVTVDDIALAEREGFRSVEHLKRYTTLGMATDQGRIGGVPGLGILSELVNRSIPQVGTTTYRPPYTPIALGALAGHHRGKDFRPTRLPPSHQWALEHGAVMVETGAWLRAQYYPRPGETDWLETVKREVSTVRSAVGVCDVSTLGKIDIQGGDAGAFPRSHLHQHVLIVAGRQGALRFDAARGRLRHGRRHHVAARHRPLFHDHDDGQRRRRSCSISNSVIRCFGPSSTCRWSRCRSNGRSIRSPGRSRATRWRNLVDAQHDIANEAFPHLAAEPVTVMRRLAGAALPRSPSPANSPMRSRCPRATAMPSMRAVMQAGKTFGITPYGTEALSAMRIEKGHVADQRGQRADHRARSGRLADAVGAQGFHRPGHGRAPGARGAGPACLRRRETRRSQRACCAPARISCRAARSATAANDQGYITSVAFSPTLGHWIGLGLLQYGPQRIGERHTRLRSRARRRRGSRSVPSGFLRSRAECASMPEIADCKRARHSRVSLCQGGPARRHATPGLLIEERTDLALATVMARHGKEQDLKGTVAAAYGLDLPDGPRVASKDGFSFDRDRCRSVVCRGRAGPGPTSLDACARASRACVDCRPVRWARRAAVAWRPRSRGAGEGSSARPASEALQDRRCRIDTWSPMSACRSNSSTISRPFSSWLSAVLPAASGRG